MRRIRRQKALTPVCRIILATVISCVGFGAPKTHAEKADLSRDELRRTATHVIVGRAEKTYCRVLTRVGWKRLQYVTLVRVFACEKGDFIQKGDFIPVRYWHSGGWSGKGPAPNISGTNGHRGLPAENDVCRIYLARNCYDGFGGDNHDGGFNVVGANGFERLRTWEASELDFDVPLVTGNRSFLFANNRHEIAYRGNKLCVKLEPYSKRWIQAGSLNYRGNVIPRLLSTWPARVFIIACTIFTILALLAKPLVEVDLKLKRTFFGIDFEKIVVCKRRYIRMRQIQPFAGAVLCLVAAYLFMPVKPDEPVLSQSHLSPAQSRFEQVIQEVENMIAGKKWRLDDERSTRTHYPKP